MRSSWPAASRAKKATEKERNETAADAIGHIDTATMMKDGIDTDIETTMRNGTAINDDIAIATTKMIMKSAESDIEADRRVRRRRNL